MNVLVIGGGRVGAGFATALAEEGHHVVVVEKASEVAARLRDGAPRLKDGAPAVVVVHGDGDEPVVLERAQVSRADLVAALAHEDEDNLVACLLAKNEYGVAHTFARVNTPANEWLFTERFGVDEWLRAEAIEPRELARRLAG